MKLTHTTGAPPATPTSITSNRNMGHKRGGTSTSTENLLPSINYDYARWNSAISPQHSPSTSNNNHNINNNISAPPSASLPVVTPPASRGGLFASTLPPLTTSASVPNLNQQHQQQHPRPATGRSTTSNVSINSTSTLLAAREYLSSPSPSPPGSPASPTTPSALPLLLATPAAAVSNANVNNNKNSDKNNNTNNDETAPAGGLFSPRNKRLTTLQEESESMSAAGAGVGAGARAGGVGGGPVSWASSAVRSSTYSSEGELFDMYLPSVGGSGGGGLHAPMRSRDSPTLGGWAGWANAGRKRQEDDEAQQQQRTPSSLVIRPLQTRQKEPTTGWRVW